MLTKSKLNSIDTLISQAFIEMMKDNLRDKNGESYEIMRFNSLKSKI